MTLFKQDFMEKQTFIGKNTDNNDVVALVASQ